MPLIVLSGFPSSGKTHRARQLQSFLESRISAAAPGTRASKLKIFHVSDDTLGIRRTVYNTARAEKDARAAFYSAIKRNLNGDTVVLADGLNYIKGYRYQLHCEAKEARTSSCVIHVGTPTETCRARNRQKLEQNAPDAYAEEDFDNLVFRYEEPNGMNRWDSPLFTVLDDDEAPPFEQIWEALLGADGRGKVVRPNQATVLQPATQQNALYELEKQTTDIVSQIQTYQQDHEGESGGHVSVSDVEQAVRLPASLDSRPIAPAQLQRLRRQFVALNRQHTLDKTRVRSLFVDYLNDCFERQ